MTKDIDQITNQLRTEISLTTQRLADSLMSSEIQPTKEKVRYLDSNMSTITDSLRATVSNKADMWEFNELKTRVGKIEENSVFLSNNPHVVYSFIQISSKALRVTLPYNETTINVLSNNTLKYTPLLFRENNQEPVTNLNTSHTMVDTFLYAELAQYEDPQFKKAANEIELQPLLVCVMLNSPKTLELIEEIKFEEMLKDGKVDKND